MATFSKVKLSESTNGTAILVAATTTAGTLLHTTTANLDEVWLYAYNNHTSDVLLTVEFGGVTVPNHIISLTVSYKSGLALVSPGLLLTGSLAVRAFAATTNVITISGYVNRIS